MVRVSFYLQNSEPWHLHAQTLDINISEEREPHIYLVEVININKGKGKERYIYQMKKLLHCASARSLNFLQISHKLGGNCAIAL